MASEVLEQARSGSGHQPLRKCAVTGEVRSKEDLVRFVASPEGEIVPDVAGTLPGRGVWVTARSDVVARAAVKGHFARSLRAPVKADRDLAETVERLLAKRCLQWLGLARRSGAAVTGYEKVRAAVAGGGVAALIAARDAAAGGRDKLKRLARARGAGAAYVDLFEAAELAEALGQPHVVHAALYRGRLADSFLADAGRLRGFRQPAEPNEDRAMGPVRE